MTRMPPRKWFALLFVLLGVAVIWWQGTVAAQARHQAEQAAANMRRYTTLIQASPIAIVTCDGTMKIQTFNPAAESMFGYKHCEIIGKSIHLLVPPSFRQHHTEVVDLATAKLAMRPEDWEISKICAPGTALHSDGHTFPVLVTIYGLKTDGKYEYAAFIMPVDKSTTIDRPARKD